MRLCRFRLDDVVLSGFYDDDRVIPIDQAAEYYGEAEGVDLILPATTDLLNLLPPDGATRRAVLDLSEWVDGLDVVNRGELAIPVEEVQLLVPIAAPRKLLLLAGNYAEHVIERGGVAAERGETFPYVFMKPPTTTLTHPGDPVVLPRASPDHVDWECEPRRGDRPPLPRRRGVGGAGVRRRVHRDQRHQRPPVPAQPGPQGPRTGPLLRLAARQVARHLLPGRPVHRVGRHGRRPAGPGRLADGQRRPEAGGARPRR